MFVSPIGVREIGPFADRGRLALRPNPEIRSRSARLRFPIVEAPLTADAELLGCPDIEVLPNR